MSVSVIVGDEPFLTLEAAWREQRQYQQKGYVLERVQVGSDSDWSDILADTQVGSLFHGQRLLRIETPTVKLGKAQLACLQDATLHAHPDTHLLWVGLNLEASTVKTRPFQNLQSSVPVTVCRPLKANAYLPWVRERAKRLNVTLTPAVEAALVQQLDQQLLATHQYLKQAANQPDADEATLLALLHCQPKGDVFAWADAMLAGDVSTLARHHYALRQGDTPPLLVIGVLQKTLRDAVAVLTYVQAGQSLSEALRAAGVWSSKARLLDALRARHQPLTLTPLLQQSLQLADALKRGEPLARVWEHLERLSHQCAQGVTP